MQKKLKTLIDNNIDQLKLIHNLEKAEEGFADIYDIENYELYILSLITHKHARGVLKLNPLQVKKIIKKGFWQKMFSNDKLASE